MPLTLHGKKILITREESQAKEFTEKVLLHGGNPFEVPLLKISCKDNPENKQLLQNVNKYKWIFFMSANGVECFFQLAMQYNLIKDFLAKSNFAAVGHKTAQVLRDYGYQADFIPTTYNAEAMASEFLACNKGIDEPLLLVRGNRSRDVIPSRFAEHGICYTTVEVYDTTYNFQQKVELNRLLHKEKVDFITFTSPSTVEAFVEMQKGQISNNPVFVCIGTSTEERASELGVTNILIPEYFTIDGMLEQISNYLATKG